MKELLSLMVNACVLMPLDDDVLIKVAPLSKKASDVDALRVKIHKSMYMTQYPKSKLRSLEEACRLYLPAELSTTDTRNGEGLFDEELGQCLSVIESLGALPGYFEAVSAAWSVSTKTSRSPVAWLDGIARSQLRAFTDGTRKDSPVEAAIVNEKMKAIRVDISPRVIHSFPMIQQSEDSAVSLFPILAIGFPIRLDQIDFSSQPIGTVGTLTQTEENFSLYSNAPSQFLFALTAKDAVEESKQLDAVEKSGLSRLRAWVSWAW